MPLKLMYITNRPEVALIAEEVGVDRIFVDMEYIGKAERQKGLDVVLNRHTVDDVRAIRSVLTKSDLLVRVNPIHKETVDYCGSEEEINQVIEAGADIVMLPFFKTVEDVRRFIAYVGKRARVLLLMETPEAAELVDDIVGIPGVDEIHIGINDMSLGYGKKFMFELLADGTVERLCMKFKSAGIPYGFGGVACVGAGALPADSILKEHYRLGSSMVILSRSFCKANHDTDLSRIRESFEIGVSCIRILEKEIALHSIYFEENREAVVRKVAAITDQIELGTISRINE